MSKERSSTQYGRQMLKAHGLAQYIMVYQAKEIARQSRVKNGWPDFYDPLAATCLGNLIYQTMTGRRT